MHGVQSAASTPSPAASSEPASSKKPAQGATHPSLPVPGRTAGTSPDPLLPTDRYRLVMPYTDSLQKRI